MTTEKKRRFPLATVLLFVIAVLLLLFSTLGGARAALTYSTEANAYTNEIGMMSAGISLYENGKPVSGTLLDDFGESDGFVVPNKDYEEVLYVENSGDPTKGDVDEYIRVVIYAYWADEKDEKAPELDASFIIPHILGGNWLRDDSACTDERTVLYYSKVVPAGGSTEPFMDSLKIDEKVLYYVSQTSSTSAGHTTYSTNFFYDGKHVCLEVEADAVQSHHAQDAILSAWGRSVSIDEASGTLRLN